MPLKFFYWNSGSVIVFSSQVTEYSTYLYSNKLLISLCNKKSRGRQLLGWLSSSVISQAVSIFHFFHPYFVNLKHYACCPVLQDGYSSRHSSPHSRQKEGIGGRCHSAVTGLTRVSPETPLVKAHLNLIGQSCHMAIHYCKQGWEASTFLMALDRT